MRPFETQYISHESTKRFSPMVLDYLRSAPQLDPFQAFPASWEGLDAALASRKQYPVDRQRLVRALERQYAELDLSQQPAPDWEVLAQENCFTVCTAHQPNLFTGYLYFIYKILHAVRLAEALGKRHPDKEFRPIFYLGTEDNDLEELGKFWYRDQVYTWDGEGQTGAVGRMENRGILPLWESLSQRLGPPGPHLDQLKTWVERAYFGHKTVGAALRQWLHDMFGHYGLIILDADDRELKDSFRGVMEEEMRHQSSEPLVRDSMEKLSEHYHPQVFPRPINLFYLEGQVRDRIRREGEEWVAPAAGKRWTESQWLQEMESHPERFSPNVILRALYQETLLPNLAFIGGGSELAYWMQVKGVFDLHGVFFPVLLLRQSMSWVDLPSSRLRKKLGLSLEQVFGPKQELIREFVEKHSDPNTKMPDPSQALKEWAIQVEERAQALDPGLNRAIKASLKRMDREVERMEKKMHRARRKKLAVELRRIEDLLCEVLPGGGLDERHGNFMEYYLDYGPVFFDLIYEGIRPLGDAFLVIEAQEAQRS